MPATLKMGETYLLPFNIPSTELLAGTTIELVAPVNGFIRKMRTTVQTAVTTGGAITVNVNTVAVPGLSITVADAAAKGTRQEDIPSSGGGAVVAGDRIEIVPAAAFATAGAVSGLLEINTGLATP
jgi:hypothetical protein